MSDTLLLLIVVALNLAMASGLAFARLRALGWPTRRVWTIVAEMWAFFALMVAGCWWASARIGGGSGRGAVGFEFESMAERFSALGPGEKAAFAALAVAAVALFAHLLASLNKGMRRGPQ
jgi:hypothetical protein